MTHDKHANENLEVLFLKIKDEHYKHLNKWCCIKLEIRTMSDKR